MICIVYIVCYTIYNNINIYIVLIIIAMHTIYRLDAKQYNTQNITIYSYNRYNAIHIQ